MAIEPVAMNTPANELLGVLVAALESAVVGEGGGTVGDAATAAGVASAIEEGVGVAWAPADVNSRAPAPTTRTSPMMPSPATMGAEIRRDRTGAWLEPGGEPYSWGCTSSSTGAGGAGGGVGVAGSGVGARDSAEAGGCGGIEDATGVSDATGASGATWATGIAALSSAPGAS